MLKLSAETNLGETVTGIRSYCVPHHHSSKKPPLSVARKLAQHCRSITYTQVCRSHKTVASAQKALTAAASIKEITTVLAVTGDKASSSDISVFELIKCIDRKRFSVAAAVVFTRKNEAQRIARKAAAGATIFYTQPVFGSNREKLAKTLKQLQKVKCEVRIGVLIPFPAAVCMKIAKEKPDFIPGSAFTRQLAAAENKGARSAYAATVKIAWENLSAAMKAAAAANAGSEGRCKVTGIHFYGLTDRVFGSGKQKTAVTAAELLKRVVAQLKSQKAAQKT